MHVHCKFDQHPLNWPKIQRAPVNMLFFKRKIPLVHGAVALLTLLFVSASHAEIYKHVDAQGRVTYSNVPIKGATKLNLEPLTTVPGPRAKTSAPTPASFPKVDSDTQKKRDDTRRKILEEELATEEKLLADAAKKQSKEEIDLHEKNVSALKKELSSLK
ncbi:MAG: DUF4124 domain-containing protein [Sulfuricella sp.]